MISGEKLCPDVFTSPCNASKKMLSKTLKDVQNSFFKLTTDSREKGVKYMFKFNSKNTRTTSVRRCGGIIVNFEHVLHLFLVFLSLTLNE